jgi:hypothetical protein
MTQDEIKRTWRNLLIPFIAGLLILAAGISLYKFGTNSSSVYGIYISIFGIMLTGAAALKVRKFRKYLRDNNL